MNHAMIKDLYQKYGFTTLENANDYIVFQYSNNNYFKNVEIVYDNHNETIDQIVLRYQNADITTNLTQYSSQEMLHKRLLQGFFSVEASRMRLQQEYKRFVEQQREKSLVKNYNYIECRYFDGYNMCKDGLVLKIYNILNQEGPQLVLLEAAAGFGKTCTSFEVVNLFTQMKAHGSTPIFTELSKNRKAAIFRYVLLDEIDKNYPALSSELVEYEIRTGQVPVIIDGFDELLSKSVNSTLPSHEDTNSDAKTMLDTIAELLSNNSNAKILLTSRKSSIFSGDEFDTWVSTKLSCCNLTRISIEAPTITDWLGTAKTQILTQKGVDITDIANPVILSILNEMTIEDFSTQCSNTSNVLDMYFQTLLTREKSRQLLRIEPNEQLEIMTNLAAYFVFLDISSEEKQIIYDAFAEILETRIATYIARYYLDETKPSEQTLINKLTDHALLNRTIGSNSNIGFLNDFIFGYFIGKGLVDKLDLLKDQMIGDKYIDLACTAYAVQNSEERAKLYDIITPSINKYTSEKRISIDMSLNRTLSMQYCDAYFDSLVFQRAFEFKSKFTFSRCTFIYCSFDKCKLFTSAFSDCHFIECSFYDTEVNADTSANRNLVFIECRNEDAFVSASCYQIQIPDNEKNYDQILLEQFWKKGRASAELKRSYRTLLKGIPMNEMDYIDQSLARLKAANIIIKDGHYLILNIDKMDKIREILGR